MDSNEPDKNLTSHPLKHLLSLEWDDLNDISLTTKSLEEDDKPLKPKKKVRFSDTVQQTYVDSNDLESNVSDSESENDISQYDDDFSDYKEDFEDDEDSESKEPGKLEVESECDKNMSQQKDMLPDELCDLMESSLSVDNQTKNLDDINAEVEKQILQFSFQIQKEKPEIAFDGTENKTNLVSCDISELHDPRNEVGTPETTSFERKIPTKCDKRTLQKQSDKINELLKNTDLSSSNALQIRQAVWEAWSTVKKWEYITRQRERKKTSENSNCISESVTKKAEAAHQIPASRKRSARKKKKSNLSIANKQNQSSSKQREMSKADKEESEMAFKAWKKQKEELLKQNAAKQQNEKLKKRMSSLMNKEIKKERAETAFIEWKMKKMHITKKEKEKKAWLMQKEREVNEQKLLRDKEAQEIFQEWLERKYFQTENQSVFPNDRPPWFPPETLIFQYKTQTEFKREMKGEINPAGWYDNLIVSNGSAV